MLRLTLAVLLALVFVVSPCAADVASERAAILAEQRAIRDAAGTAPESTRLAQLIAASFRYVMLEFPEFATSIGHPTGSDRWTDGSIAAIDRREAEDREWLATLRTLDRDKLQGEDRVNLDLLVRAAAERVEGQQFAGRYLAMTSIHGIQQDIPEMLAHQPARTVKDYEDVLSRLAGVPVVVTDTIAVLEQGLTRGVTPPQITLRDLAEQISAVMAEDPAKAPMLVAFENFPTGIDAGAREDLHARAAQVYRERVLPAFADLRAFVRDKYVPGARRTIAMKDLPDGERWYAYRVKVTTTTAMTPQEIHELGLREVGRIEAEMEKAKLASGFSGTLPELFAMMRTDPRFFYTDPDELLRGYRDIAKRADPELTKLFGRLPRLPYGVMAVPEYMAKSQPTAYYDGGALESGKPAYFYANTYDLKSRPKWEMEALTLHEAVPGHHLQISLAKEMENLPWFRRHGGPTAFIEGWGLYAEGLGEEMGFYKDPYMKLGELTYEMWRAIRLVVDTGMHALGWSRDQAIDYFKAHAGKSEHDVVVEVDRYIVWPSQALAYKIGQMKLRELRAVAQRELGGRFDVRAFHDQVLKNGAVPLDVLERHVTEWIAQVKAAPSP
ncbi:MAG: DUF885 domain-containing protein [Candidatus Schekmanbacteria bacterium]|nr:DUF885 domain-containing protein [Candidatus Schekmanbacteria bacterium]